MRNLLALSTLVAALAAMATCSPQLAIAERLAPPHLETPYDQVIHASLEHGVEPSLALNLAQTESGMRPLAQRHERNGTWSHGIFQLNDRLIRRTLIWRDRLYPSDPYVEFAVEYMSRVISERGTHNLTCIWRHGEWSRTCR